MRFNSCLNKKLSIDENGFLKNCPSCKEDMGLANEISLEGAIKVPEYSAYNEITKDVILICKDYEFRYVCTDCRQYLSDPTNILSKPDKCNYNPSMATWE